ncbi:MAG: hypothetical protein K0Q50_2847 [Vampirovibrio sp.]|nr:hypothetical protein [Vampirovibrio sp.]
MFLRTFHNRHSISGFTLAELLVSLAILGVIATFTIPKILQAQQSSQKNAITKETMAAVAAAYDIYKAQNPISTATGMDNLVANLNYVQQDTTSIIDHKPGVASADCSTATVKCYKLHNGAILWYSTTAGQFNGTGSGNYLLFLIDPDGVYNNGDASGKAVELFLYTTGRLTSRAIVADDSTRDPVWFSWDD